MRSVNTLRARMACSSPASHASMTERKSEVPLSPRRPDCLLSTLSIWSGVYLRWEAMKASTPASTSPARVPMTKPSRGVRPMVVSTHLPFLMAAMLAPLPRWQMMAFMDSLGLPRSSAALPSTYVYDVPWKPYRRTPCSSRRERGSAYVYDSGGMSAWNAVSKMATWGTGKIPLATRMPFRLAGLCRGARGTHRSISASTALSMTVGAVSVAPPWTTRWPTTLISSTCLMGPPAAVSRSTT
mmetsp:Transcript_20617/g.55622  ORF Transcript_20617/g.55622 Transcript_20617/m.55622 type:complete len:241 (+) Transcript_20617:298-1020(+)